jgi:spermidine synthase
MVKEKLTDDGIFSFRVSSAENYISPELQDFLSSLYFTSKEAFPFIEIVPGDTNIFLASSSPLSIEHEKLSQKITGLNLQNTYISPQLLFARLSPLRVDMVREKVTSGKKAINLDFSPISYFYNSVLWSTQFKGIERKIFTFFSSLHSFWLLDLPLMIIVCTLILLWLRGKKSSFFLVPLAVMGFTTIVGEIIVIISFQTLYGYLYRSIALLLTAFMVGLFLGSLRGKKRKKFDFSRLLLIQAGFLLLLLLLQITLKLNPPELFFFFFLLALGFLGGDLFVVSNHLFLKEKTNFGLGYGLDLLGSFVGALAVSSLLIPLVGLPHLLNYLFLLNSFCLLFLVAGWKKY